MLCSVEDCGKEATRKGHRLCEKHYYRQYRYGSVNVKKKAANGEAANAICKVNGCDRSVYGIKLCLMHYQRYYRIGYAGQAEPLHRLDGEGHLNQNGYIIHTRNKERKREHREVAEKALGKPLPKGSVVHYLNGIRTDNRPCNLVICPSESYHQELHYRQRISGYKGPAPLQPDSKLHESGETTNQP